MMKARSEEARDVLHPSEVPVDRLGMPRREQLGLLPVRHRQPWHVVEFILIELFERRPHIKLRTPSVRKRTSEPVNPSVVTWRSG
jgi:hypothetical protein